jgi:hypothetical protein
MRRIVLQCDQMRAADTLALVLDGRFTVMKSSALFHEVLRNLLVSILLGIIGSQISLREAAAQTDTPGLSILSNEKTDGEIVLRSRVNMVLVPVSVTDKQERSVLGLSKVLIARIAWC